ncbi:MAG: hypothetical protein R2830_13505 [Saprospiraceae bacterium]
MTRLFIWLLLALLPTVTVMSQACCNAGGLASCGSTGLLTGLRSSSAGLRLMRVPFTTNSNVDGDSYKDDFYVAELAVRYQISPRWKVALQQPYRWNVRQQTGETETLQGFADTRLTGSFALLDNFQLGGHSMLYWEIGTGIKLPTGKYDQSIYFRDLPGNLNLGMGNMGYLFLTNAVFFKSKYGLSLNAGYQLNGKSRDDYHFGDQFTAALSLFREFAVGEKWKLVPFAGASVEKFGKNFLPSGNFAEGSGGEGWLAMLGGNVRYGDLQLSLSASRPFHQNYSSGAIVAKQRYTLEFTYFF